METKHGTKERERGDNCISIYLFNKSFSWLLYAKTLINEGKISFCEMSHWLLYPKFEGPP